MLNAIREGWPHISYSKLLTDNGNELSMHNLKIESIN